jgi:hypothetical protein
VKSFPQAKEPQTKDSKQDQWKQSKREKTNGKEKNLNRPQGQGKKSIDPLERTSSSPQKGESSHNQFFGLPNSEENMEVHMDNHEGNGERRQEETKEENRKGKEKEILISSGENTAKFVSNLLPEILVFSEEEQQETYDSDSDLEVTQPATLKKVGRKSNRNKRESIADREKVIGIQKTLEEALRKESKSSKKSQPITREQLLSPLKGGTKIHL